MAGKTPQEIIDSLTKELVKVKAGMKQLQEEKEELTKQATQATSTSSNQEIVESLKHLKNIPPISKEEWEIAKLVVSTTEDKDGNKTEETDTFFLSTKGTKIRITHPEDILIRNGVPQSLIAKAKEAK